jgi:sugar lactone lactonase YvrE
MGGRTGVALAMALLAGTGCKGGGDVDHPAGLVDGGGAGGAGGTGGEGGLAQGGSGGGGTGGADVPPGPPVQLAEHVQIWTAAQGVPGRFASVAVDRGGNVWAAERTGKNAGRLRLLRKGAALWERFEGPGDGLAPWPVMSVGGGRAGEVYVGYQGLFPDGNVFDDPPEVAKSGDVDRLRLTADGFDRLHYDISSPPDDTYPNGRDTLRTCYRIVPVLTGPYAGDVWFGCNHGMAQYSARFDRVLEHRHTAINRGTTLFSGDFRGLALAPDGDVWIGGAHRGGRIHYAAGGDFWAPIDPVIDAFPDGVAKNPEGDDWTMAMAVEPDGTLWVGGYGNGLARRAPDGTWSYFDSGAGLPDDRVSDLALDTDGSLWVACDRAAARIAGGAVVQVLDNMNGPPGTVLSVAIDDIAKPRRVIVGTSQGVGIYDGP